MPSLVHSHFSAIWGQYGDMAFATNIAKIFSPVGWRLLLVDRLVHLWTKVSGKLPPIWGGLLEIPTPWYVTIYFLWKPKVATLSWFWVLDFGSLSSAIGHSLWVFAFVLSSLSWDYDMTSVRLSIFIHNTQSKCSKWTLKAEIWKLKVENAWPSYRLP